MSWSVNIEAQPFETFLKAVDQAHLPEDTYNPPELVAQWGEQLEGAKRAIMLALVPDVFAHGEGATYSASMGGHANHGGAGEDTSYTTSEFVSVTVNRHPPKPPTE
jgi:hypothetical protein